MDRRSFLLSVPVLGFGLNLRADELLHSSRHVTKKIGIIGLDSTHALAFTKAINSIDKDLYGRYQVVAAYPFGSRTIPLSQERIPRFTEEMRAMGIDIVSSIGDLLNRVDCVLLETNDGNLHLEQAMEVIKARKPLFIDKPIANSYEDAYRIFLEADKYNCPVFSSSALRYIDGLESLNRNKVLGADIYSPAYKEPSHKDLYWYGIHGVEMLFALMGPECRSVQTVEEKGASIYIGTWADGRCGTLRGIRSGKDDFGGTVFLENEIVRFGKFNGYGPLLDKILAFFDSGISPVSQVETLAICAFIDAAEKSKQKNGKTIRLSHI